MTFQEQHITYPTDEKLYKKEIDRCIWITRRLGEPLRQSHRFVAKKLRYAMR
ncbi:MAG: hypothetical protein AAFQ08_02275 [Bacteroidota bacterium]